MTTPEGKVKNYLLSRCSMLGLKAYKCSFDNQKGAPDWLVIGNGRNIFIELKSPKGKVTSIQRRVHKMLGELGGFSVFVCDDEPSINEALTELAP